MLWDWNDYSGVDASAIIPLLLSERTQQLLLAAIKNMDNESLWTGDFDEIDAALGEAYTEILTEIDMSDSSPVGMVAWFPVGATDIPAKWLKCEGQAVNDTDYPELCAVLHVAFLVSTGNYLLPDLRERFLYGVTSDGDVGDVGGAATHTLSIAELPAHAHTFDKGNAEGNTQRALEASAATASFPTQTTSIVGSGEAHNNMPPYMRGYWCIKALP